MSPRVLLVDDEPSLVRGLSYALEREGFQVDVATDGEEAVRRAASTAFDLVILDVGLPLLTGTDACIAIRAVSAVPVIMLTARDAVRDLVEGLEAGADDYVTKPFSSAELIGRIRALLRRRELDRLDSSLVQEVGDLRIDLAKDEVELGGTRVLLTPSEFKILSLLASSPGHVFTRRQIMETLWSSAHVGDERTCEVHVSSLRRKLEQAAPGAGQRVRTVRGTGYRLTS